MNLKGSDPFRFVPAPDLAVPKAELHVHLEGTAPPELVRRLAQRNGLPVPEGVFADEETIRVPLIISNPLLFPEARSTDALATLADVTPTLTALAGIEADDEMQGRALTPILARHASPSSEALSRSGADLDPVTSHPAPAASVQEAVHFTYDDHQAGTALTNAPGQPNRVRAVREKDAKYAVYLDPDGNRDPEYELYDLDRDPLEVHNLLDHRSGEPLDPAHGPLRDRLAERLVEISARLGTGLPPPA